MQPHETKKTLSLNEARNCIIAMSKPMGQAVQLIEMNLKKIKVQCKMADAEIRSLQGRLKCKSQNKEFVSVEVRIQNKIRRENSDLISKKEALERSIKEFEEKKKFIYEFASYFGVFLKENALIPYNDSFSEYLDMLIKDEETKERFIRDDKRIEQMKKDKQTYEKKKEIIMRNITSGSKGKNEVIPIEKIYNDSFSEYLDMLIKDEETKERFIRDDKRIEQLKKDKQTYEKEKEIIMRNITSGSKGKNEVIPIEKIEEMKQKLFSLKHNGRTLNEALGIVHCFYKVGIFSNKYKVD